MEKVFSRVNWQNEPSTATPINERNLNKSDNALDVIDGRVVALDARVANIESIEPRLIGYQEATENYAEDASDSATAAATSETNALSYKTDAQNSATNSRSWAVGGTNTRTGEDTNNSMYYVQQAQACVSNGGFCTFTINADGDLVYTRTVNLIDKLTFRIVNQEDLEVSISG